MSAVSEAVARVREIAAAEPSADLDVTGLALWYAERLGELRWHAGILADHIDARPADPAPDFRSRIVGALADMRLQGHSYHAAGPVLLSDRERIADAVLGLLAATDGAR